MLDTSYSTESVVNLLDGVWEIVRYWFQMMDVKQ